MIRLLLKWVTCGACDGTGENPLTGKECRACRGQGGWDD